MRLPFESQKGCCRICGRHVEGFEGEYLCDRCAADPPWFEKAAGALRFEEEARRMVIDFKFNNHLWLRDDLTDWLEAAVSARLDVAAVDAVVPMPATVVHRLLRGYNQCDALAKNLARRIGRKYLSNAVRRCGFPRRQSGLDADERRENVKGTFRVVRPEAVRGRTLLVVDDVLTTGSTLSECALALKAAGAERVWCVTLAKSVID
jgi:ComF family protein